MRTFNNVLVTGGAGFIGSNFIISLFKRNDFLGKVVNIDKLTYAGNLENLLSVHGKYAGKRYFFEKADIADISRVREIIKKHNIDLLVNFAAESHVDRSISGPNKFINTNVVGTFVLLEAVRELWKNKEKVLFHHVSTDEVYGSLGKDGYFEETTAYSPRSPYSASKAASDHFVKAYFHTYDLPVTISNCSNNYGPFQFPEKLIPLALLNVLEEKPIPVYGDGKYIRDWLYVDDHSQALWTIITSGRLGETYNIGGEKEWENIRLVNTLCEKVALLKGENRDAYKGLITYVQDRPGHDRRYSVNCEKIIKELGWKASVSFAEGLDKTIAWYMANEDWIKNIKNGEYRNCLSKLYG